MHDSNELPVFFNPPPTVTLITICLVCMYYVAFHFNHLPHNTLPPHPLSQTYFLHTFLQCTHLLNSHILPLPFFTHTPSLHPHTQNPSIFTPPCSPSTLYIFKPKTARVVRAPLRRVTTAGALTAFRS